MSAGVAALIKSQHPKMSQGALKRRIDDDGRPDRLPGRRSIYAFFPAVDNGAPQVCTGGTGLQLVQRPRPGERVDCRHEVDTTIGIMERRRPFGRRRFHLTEGSLAGAAPVAIEPGDVARYHRAVRSEGPMLTLDTIRQAPKALLHDHLDGGLRPATIIDLAR